MGMIQPACPVSAYSPLTV